MTNRKGPCEEVTKFKKRRGPVPGKRARERMAEIREAAPGRGREKWWERSEKQEEARLVWPLKSGVHKLWPRGHIWPAICFVSPMSQDWVYIFKWLGKKIKRGIIISDKFSHENSWDSIFSIFTCFFLVTLMLQWQSSVAVIETTWLTTIHWNVSPPNSHVEALTSKVMVFGEGAFGR